MKNIGIVEGFFGPEWDLQPRLSWAEFLKKYDGAFYIYAPKRDHFLRKGWRESWPDEYVNKLKLMIHHFHQNNIKFGVGLSPMGLGLNLSLEDKKILDDKVHLLKNIGVDLLGLFFDDMPVTNNLIHTQKEVTQVVSTIYKNGLIFCPSFYSDDPILDKVFGVRPPNYVQDLKDAIGPQIDICWTGPKVISKEMPDSHLKEVATVIGRKPFIWENLYANDGPKNCKFLKFKYFEGRQAFTPHINGLALNLMNQPELSKILYLSTLFTLRGIPPEKAFDSALTELCSHGLAQFIIKYRKQFLEEGLDQINEILKAKMQEELSLFSCAFAQDIKDYLDGKYNVGPECLTD